MYSKIKDGAYHDYDPCPIKTAEQFVPTDAKPVGLHKQMAGDPFKSQAQRGYMYANHPKLADRFEKETPKGSHLPRYAKKHK